MAFRWGEEGEHQPYEGALSYARLSYYSCEASGADEQQIREALYTSVAEFVYDLPDGLDTLCGEKGAGLSEGQAQRIAIARALLRPGAVILLDEPTSALDSHTENLLLQRISTRLADRTLIMVTHNSQTSDLCTDKVMMG